MAAAAHRLARMLGELGRVTDEPGRLTRTFLSPGMRQANQLVAGWMRAAGLKVREDAVGNLIGRTEAAGRTGTLLLGSHLDTVRNAGRFDGALGVLLPVVALSELRRQRRQLPFAVEVIGFAEEEGVRFGSAYLGSKGYLGRLRARDLAQRDPHGTTVRAAIGGRPPHRAPGRPLLGYLEVHIEQGPVLEAEKLAVGVVSGIAGQTRARLTWRGAAGHAGTTPMNWRRDALAGAAEFILAVEARARKNPALVGTVGTIAALPGAANVIPGEVSLSLDVRHPRDGARRAALAGLRREAQAIARRRGLRCGWRETQDNRAVVCSRDLTARLARSVGAVQGRSLELVSGAGHDAVILAGVTDVAMLFVRCRGGLSHHPDEFASTADMGVALDVVMNFLQNF